MVKRFNLQSPINRNIQHDKGHWSLLRTGAYRRIQQTSWGWARHKVKQPEKAIKHKGKPSLKDWFCAFGPAAFLCGKEEPVSNDKATSKWMLVGCLEDRIAQRIKFLGWSNRVRYWYLICTCSTRIRSLCQVKGVKSPFKEAIKTDRICWGNQEIVEFSRTSLEISDSNISLRRFSLTVGSQCSDWCRKGQLAANCRCC